MRAHHDIQRDGDIIIITLKGAFSDEDLRRCHRDLLPHIQALNNQPFAVLTDIVDFSGATPEAFDTGNAFNQWLNELAFVAKAIVTTSQLMISIAHQNSPALKQQNFKSFANKTEALRWLRQQLDIAQIDRDNRLG